MHRKVILSFAILVILITTENSYSFDTKDFQQLIATKNCIECDLSYADLTDLSKNNLSGINLSGSNLVGVKLPVFNHPKYLLECAGALGINFHDPIYDHS